MISAPTISIWAQKLEVVEEFEAVIEIPKMVVGPEVVDVGLEYVHALVTKLVNLGKAIVPHSTVVVAIEFKAVVLAERYWPHFAN